LDTPSYNSCCWNVVSKI